MRANAVGARSPFGDNACGRFSKLDQTPILVSGLTAAASLRPQGGLLRWLLQDSRVWCVAVDVFRIEYLLGFRPLKFHVAVRLL